MRAPVLLPVAVLVGIFLGWRAAPGPAGWLLGAAIACGVAAMLTRRSTGVVLLLAALVVGGAAQTQRARDGLVHSPFASLVAARADVVVRGVLADDPDGDARASRVVVRVDTIDDGTRRLATDRRVLVAAGGDDAVRLRVLAAGDRVELAGWVGPLDGWNRRLEARHVVARLRITDVRAVAPADRPLWRMADWLRGLVRRGLGPLPGPQRALAAGLLLGDTRDVSSETVVEFRNAGLSHLMAVSGANVAFVLAMVAPLLRVLPLRGRVIAATAVIVVFAAVTRFEPSVLRASVMAGVALAGTFVGRPVHTGRALCLAVGALLLVDPFLVRSVGFQLSCGASAGLVLFAGPITSRLRGPRVMREAAGATMAAQIGVAPIALPVFGSLPLVSVPANVLAVPLAAPLTAYGLPAAIVGGAIAGIFPLVTAALTRPTGVLVTAVAIVADVASRVPLAFDLRRGIGAVALVAVIAAAVIATRAHATRAPPAGHRT